MLSVVTGPMFAGKSHELIRRVHRAVIARKKVVVVKPSLDRRYSRNEVVSHDGQRMAAYPVEPHDVGQVLDLCRQMQAQLLAVDEVQFFPETIVGALVDLAHAGVDVVACGLDLDYLGRPFTTTALLMAYADEVLKLSAICARCQSDARYTQMVVDGQPYTLPLEGGSTIRPGGSELYEARCRRCWVRPMEWGGLEGNPQPAT